MGSREIYRMDMGHVLHQSLSITGTYFTNISGIKADSQDWQSSKRSHHWSINLHPS
jgi:hypothetical protein